MNEARPSFKDDLQASIGYAVLLQALIAAAYILPIEVSAELSARTELRLFEPFFFFMPILTLWLHSLRAEAGRWFAVLAPALLVIALQQVLAIPGLLALMALPVGLAAALISLRAASGTALLSLAAVLALAELSPAAAGDAQTLIALASISTTYLMMVAVKTPIEGVAGWAWEYYQKGSRLVEETRAQRGELTQALADLEHANRQMALLYERQTALQRIAEEARRTKTAFVAKVSHEFRTPLNMIIGLAAVMIENPQMYGRSLSPALMEDLRIIQRNCEHLSGLVNDVLALSQAQAGQLALHREPLHLDELIHGAVDVVRPLLDKKNLYLKAELPPNLPEVSVDRTRIRQVILNLLSNAARFTDQGGITVQVEEEENNLRICVSDTGPGIPPEDIDKIFEPFCQGSEQGWRDKGGSGLGLTISKQFVELHGGRIWLESTPGAGTAFFVSLPKMAPLAPAARPERWINREWAWVERRGRSTHEKQPSIPRVVVCDATQELSQTLLDFSSNIEMVAVSSLAEVVANVQETPAHAVLIGAPNGKELHPLVKQARRELPDTPVVGCIIPTRVAPALQAGANQYLVKPVQQAMLFETFRGLACPPRHVLIADDDPDARLLMARMVALYNREVQIYTAGTGREALKILQEWPIDLLLLDMIMPESDGMQVLEAIRKQPDLDELCVVVISAQDPLDTLPVCKEMLVTLGEGISLPKALECSLGVSELLFKPEPEPFPTPQ